MAPPHLKYVQPVKRVRPARSSRCIFCLEPLAPGGTNREHVFPDAMGGTLVIEAQCTHCNSTLGATVDPLLTEHGLIRLKRMNYRLAGKRGRVPDPLARGRLASNPRVLVDLGLDEEGNARAPKIQPFVEEVRDDKGTVVGYRGIGDAGDEGMLLEIINKKLRRAGKPERTEADMSVTPAEPGEELRIQYEFKIDLVRYKRAIAKIAYEVAFFWLGESYIDDPIASELRRFIREGPWIENGVRRGVMGHSFFLDPDGPPPLPADVNDHHRAFLVRNDNDYICFVRVLGVFDDAIVVSRYADGYRAAPGYMITIDPASKETCLEVHLDYIPPWASGERASAAQVAAP